MTIINIRQQRHTSKRGRLHHAAPSSAGRTGAGLTVGAGRVDRGAAKRASCRLGGAGVLPPARVATAVVTTYVLAPNTAKGRPTSRAGRRTHAAGPGR